MSESTIKAKRLKHQDRVTLSQSSLERVDTWMSQIMSQSHGVSATRKDLVNWLILSRPVELTESEQSELRSQFFSEVRFLQQAIKDLKAARARGDGLTLQQIIGQQSAMGKAKKARRDKKKAVPSGHEGTKESHL